VNNQPPPCYIEVEVEVTLRLMVSQTVCLGVEPTLRLATRYYFLSEYCCLKVEVVFLWVPCDERMGLQFAFAFLEMLTVLQIVKEFPVITNEHFL
jgi:hypothetical protein